MKFSTAYAHFKTASAIAAALGIKHQAVAQWKAKDRVPIGRAAELERITKGAIKVDPSIYATTRPSKARPAAPAARA